MKLNFPKIIRPIDLGEYAPEWEDQKIYVWVNPPMDELEALIEAHRLLLEKNDEETVNDYLKRLSVLLSQGSDNKLSVKDLQEVRKLTDSTDPGFWPWMQDSVYAKIADYRTGQKKV